MKMTSEATVVASESPKAMKTRVIEALVAAKAAPFVSPGRGYGCGRAYVCVSSTNGKKVINAVAKACKDLGLIFIPKGYNFGNNAIYIGYDNARGNMIAKSEAFAAVLNAKGISCYPDAGED
jgi:hypothetical protein